MDLRNRLVASDRGTSMVEYSLIVAVISLMSLSAVTLLGDTTGESFDEVTEAFDDGSGAASIEIEGGEGSGNGGGGGSGSATTTTTTPPATTTTAPATTTTTASPAATPQGTLEMASTSATLTSWKKNKGDWTASVEYSNKWEHDQYLTLVVTQVDHKGKTNTTTVENFLVPAGSSARFDYEDNAIKTKKGNLTGVVEVRVEVVSINTTDDNLDDVTYEVTGQVSTISAPTP